MRRRSAKLAATCAIFVGFLGAACGAVEETREAEKGRPAADTTATTRADDVADEHQQDREKGAGPTAGDAEGEGRDRAWVTFGWSIATSSSESTGPPLVDRLSVFARPRRPGDAVPPGTLALADVDGAELEAFEGEQLLERSRLALSNAGSRNLDIYLVPTTKGFVCTYVVEPKDEFAGGHGGCTHVLAPEGYTVQMSGTDDRVEVEGLVDDSIRRVQVEVWGRPIEAEVDGNAYYVDAAVERSCPEAVEAIVLHSSSGVRRVELDHPALPPATQETFRVPGCR
jgi:hypothetical protein